MIFAIFFHIYCILVNYSNKIHMQFEANQFPNHQIYKIP